MKKAIKIQNGQILNCFTEIKKTQRMIGTGNRSASLIQGSLQTFMDNQELDNLKRDIEKRKKNKSWVVAKEEVIRMMELARRRERVREFTALLEERAKECLEMLLRTSKEELLNRCLENGSWRRSFG